MKLKKQTKTLALLFAAAAPEMVFAQASISICGNSCESTNVTSSVRLKVVVPDVLAITSKSADASNNSSELSTSWTYSETSGANSTTDNRDRIAIYTVSKP